MCTAAKEGYHCTIAFVIQMNGIHRVFPNEAKQPEFKEALVQQVFRLSVTVVMLKPKA